jgi:hypothetical protein
VLSLEHDVVLLDDYNGVAALDCLRGAKKHLLFEALYVDLDVVDVLETERVQGINGHRPGFETVMFVVTPGVHHRLTPLISKSATKMRNFAKIDIEPEVWPNARIERINMGEIQLQVARELTYAATDVDRSSKVFIKRLTQQVGQLTGMSRIFPHALRQI